MVSLQISGRRPPSHIHTVNSIQRVLEEVADVLPKELEVSVPPNCFALTRDASQVILGSTKGNLMLYSLVTDELVHEIDRSNYSIVSVCLSGDDCFLVAADAVGVVSLLAFPSLEVVKVLERPAELSLSVQLYTSDCFLLSNSDHSLACLRPDGNLQEWLRFDAAITAFAFKQETLVVACANLDLFKYEDSVPQGKPFRLPGPAKILEVTDGLIAAGLGKENAFRIVFRQIEEFVVLEGHSRSITGLAFVMEDQYLVSSAKDGHILLWKLLEARSVMNFKVYDSPVSALHFFRGCLYSAQKKHSNQLCLA